LYSTDGKSVNLTSGGGEAGGKKGLYAIQVDDREPRCYATPREWDEGGRPIRAVSCADGKVYTVYEVKDGKITIKGKEYPIKLVDGFYIIRKLTVRECMRLQTVPEWYEFPVSDTQAYKMLGNGWTVEVIRHLIRCAVKGGEKND
jgi:DNA (cytosine-5)-methyltransferase 3A